MATGKSRKRITFTGRFRVVIIEYATHHSVETPERVLFTDCVIILPSDKATMNAHETLPADRFTSKRVVWSGNWRLRPRAERSVDAALAVSKTTTDRAVVTSWRHALVRC